MRTVVLCPEQPLWTRIRDRAGPVLAWVVWAALTVAMILFIRQHARNVPFMDDFALVTMMAGQEPVSLQWAWAQHNEHRPVISRLIQAGLSRFVKNDFLTGRYFNVGVLSAAAASMLLLARRLRGFTRVTDTVLPLSILSIGQAESLMITFAMNLVLIAWISFELIATVALGDRRYGWLTTLRFGILLVLLPLSSGGLVLLPPLVLWLGGYVAWGWWSGREPGGLTRAIGLGLLMACSAIATLYLSGYSRPAYHPPAPSLAAAVSTTLEYLSMAVCPNVPRYWWPASLLFMLLVAATLVRLAVVAVRAPGERLRALGLIAIILSMLSMAAAVGLSRAGLGPDVGLASRYITTTTPLVCALYIAWLAYGPAPARRGVHVGLFALVCLLVPANIKFGLQYGKRICMAEVQVERSLKARVPASRLMSRACPATYPDPNFAYECFKMLKAARVGEFTHFVNDRMAASPGAATAVRR